MRQQHYNLHCQQITKFYYQILLLKYWHNLQQNHPAQTPSSVFRQPSSERKFANGAITGAFSRVFNDEAHFENGFEKNNFRKKLTAFVGGARDKPDGGPVITTFNEQRREGDVYFEWGDSKGLTNWIQQNQMHELTVIGHSYGGDTAATVVSKGNYVDTLVTVDPVGRTRPKFTNVAANSGVWVNYDSISTAKNWVNRVAWAGGRYNDRPVGFADLHIESKLDHVDICSVYCRPMR